jgi:ABC-type phosphate/phosphonate transport system substrate-binding protein
MTQLASLAMYDPPWLRWANDALWASLAERLSAQGIGDVPARLHRDEDLDDLWDSPSLLLAQSCGYPLMTALRESVQLVATPRYVAEGCEGASHRSAIVVRADDGASSIADLRGKRLGINSVRSNTGMNLLRAEIAPHANGQAFFRNVILTRSHARSIAALLSDRIDVAAIDAVTLAHLQDRYPRHAGDLRILAWTAASPGLPLITASATSPQTLAALRGALHASLDDPHLSEAFHALKIVDFDWLTIDDYACILDFEANACAHSYPALT